MAEYLFAEIVDDHDRFKSLLDELRHGGDRPRLLEELSAAIEPHMRAEEEIFYPAIDEGGEPREVTLKAHEEHRLIRRELDELRDLPPTDRRWSARFTVLQWMLERHIENEETFVFENARDICSDDDLASLYEGFLREKSTEKVAAEESAS